MKNKQVIKKPTKQQKKIYNELVKQLKDHNKNVEAMIKDLERR